MAGTHPDRSTSSGRWSMKADGDFAILDDLTGRDVTPRGRKTRAMLAYLGSRRGTHVSRERIAELLWGDRGDEQARASLRQALLEVRHAIGGPPNLVQSDRGHVWIDADQLSLCDVAIDAIGDEGAQPFEDLRHISAEFDEWLDLERLRHAREIMDRLRALADRHVAAGDHGAALPLICAMERIDPFDEEVLRLAMLADYQAGRSAGVEQRFKAASMRLRHELGVELSAESRALHDELIRRIRDDPAPRIQRVRSPLFLRAATDLEAASLPWWQSRIWPAILFLLFVLLAFAALRHWAARPGV